MSVATWIHEFNAAPAGALPRNVYRYVLSTSAPHQLALLALTAGVALLEVVPLELQRRIVNDLVKHRPYSWVIGLCAVYAGVVIVQGSAKLGLNIYRGWVGEQAKRDLRHRVHTVVETPSIASPAAEAQGIVISMIVAEVEPIGGFVGESVSEPLLQGGIMASVLAYLIHIDPWMALAAIGLFIPQLIFVPLLQSAVNRRTGARIQVLRQLGIAMIDRDDDAEDERRIDQAFALDMGIFKIKFTMNFLMNLCNHLQRVSALLVGGWWVYTSHLEIGGVVAFISGIGRLNDPWGDLVNYFRDLNVTQVKYRLLADAVESAGPSRPRPRCWALDCSGRLTARWSSAYSFNQRERKGRRRRPREGSKKCLDKLRTICWRCSIRRRSTAAIGSAFAIFSALSRFSNSSISRSLRSCLAVVGPQWHLTYGQSALILYSGGVGSILGALVFGGLADASGRKAQMIIGTFICAGAAGVDRLCAGRSLATFALLRFVVGVGLTAAVVPALTILVELTPTRHRTMVTSFYVVFATAGGFLASITSAALLAAIGWRGMAMLGILRSRWSACSPHSLFPNRYAG